MVQANEVLACMARAGKTRGDVANALGICPRTLTAKLKSGVFKSNEIETLIDMLHIDNPMDVFFAHE